MYVLTFLPFLVIEKFPIYTFWDIFENKGLFQKEKEIAQPSGLAGILIVRILLSESLAILY